MGRDTEKKFTTKDTKAGTEVTKEELSKRDGIAKSSYIQSSKVKMFGSQSASPEGKWNERVAEAGRQKFDFAYSYTDKTVSLCWSAGCAIARGVQPGGSFGNFISRRVSNLAETLKTIFKMGRF